MTPTRTSQLLTWGALGLIASFAFHLLLESSGRALPGMPWPAVVGMLVLSAVLLLLGWPIKRWNDGDRTRELDPVHSARVAVLAKAASLAGSLLTGWYMGAAVYLLVSASGLRSDQAMEMLAAVASSAIVMIVGLVVESFCRLPPDDTAGADPA